MAALCNQFLGAYDGGGNDSPGDKQLPSVEKAVCIFEMTWQDGRLMIFSTDGKHFSVFPKPEFIALAGKREAPGGRYQISENERNEPIVDMWPT